jgi:APA family basic amino acid/polyamine antiporter
VSAAAPRRDDSAALTGRRRLGPLAAVALVVGNIIGSGIFMLPAALAPYGWNAVPAWAIALCGALCLAWVFAQLAAQRPRAGGAHGAVADAFGGTAAFFTSWGYLASVWTANAAIAVAGVSYLQRLVPEIAAQPFGPQVAALALIAMLALSHARALAGGVQVVSTLIKILPFALVIGLAAWLLGTRGAAALAPIDAVPLEASATLAAVGVTVFALLGLESASVPADAIDNPVRNVPRATLIGTAVAGVITLLSSSAVALMLPQATLTASTAPIADFIGAFVGSGAGTFVAVCAVVSCIGALNGFLLVGGELPATMARAGTLPPWFARTNARGVPMNALWSGAAVSGLFVLLALSRGGVAAYEFVALVSTVTALFLYVVVASAAARFARDGRLASQPSLWVAICGALLFAAVTLWGCGPEAIAWSLGLLAIGWPLRRLASRG